jgi:hypothetical protein
MAHEEQTESISSPPGGIAVVGMVGRFPGARDLDAYWRIIREGAETLTFFSDDQLIAAGFDPQVVGNSAYVKARGVIEEIDLFDASFFGYSHREALLMDPQQRLFLQLSWEALEAAGCDPRSYRGLIGVYGGATASSYQPILYSNPDGLGGADGLSIALGNELPFLTTRVSYKLDLKGPSCPVQTACSTSLVAVHLACQGLLNAECDMALAGGVSLRLPQEAGYFYQDESILSPDGHCRSFDANAAGTVFSNGAGIVVLKRVEDALADGDTIYAVIRGSAINNDGSRRASFTAPGVTGQSQVIADALASAEVDPETINYIEAHGTATSLGVRLRSGADQGLWNPEARLLRDWIGQSQHRSPGYGGRRRGPDQDHSRAATQAAPADGTLHTGQSRHPFRNHAVLRERSASRVEAAGGRAAARRRQLVRLRGDQRARGGRAPSVGPTGRPRLAALTLSAETPDARKVTSVWRSLQPPSG